MLLKIRAGLDPLPLLKKCPNLDCLKIFFKGLKYFFCFLKAIFKGTTKVLPKIWAGSGRHQNITRLQNCNEDHMGH